jgi:fibronectin-binding autotransporter adhesin
MAAVPMKTQPIKVTTQARKKLPGILAAISIRPDLIALSLFVATSAPVLALDAVWLPSPGTGDWNTGTNWSTSPSAPVNPLDNATFNTSTKTSLTLSAPATVEKITFNGASAFTITTRGLNTLTIEGTGIINNSTQTQTIVNTIDEGGGGVTQFLKASTAGNATINNIGTTTNFAGSTNFSGTSTAGNATINNITGGSTNFSGTSTAGGATITSNGGTLGGAGGSTNFSGSSDGGTARAITNGNGSFDISGLTTAGMGIGSIEGSGNYFLGSKTLSVGGNNLSTTVSGVIQDGGAGGSLTKIGTGTLTLTRINTYTGITTINAGVLSISQDANLGTPRGTPVGNQLTFNGGTLQATASFALNPNRGVTLLAGGGTIGVTGANVLTYGGVIIGSGSLTKSDAGTLFLSGANTYTGATTVNSGVLQAGSKDALSAGSAFTVNTGAELDLNGFNNTVGSLSGSGLVSNTGGIGAASSATLSVGADNTSTTFSGTLRDGVSTLPLTLALNKVGTGTLTLTGANTYRGGTNLNGGTLAVNRDANLGFGALSFNGGTLEALTVGGGIVSGKAITLNAGGGTFLADAGTGSTLNGTITGVGAWTKTGPGPLILSGANAYTGTTTVIGGSLIVDGSIASAQTLVNTGGLLGGHGSLGGNLVNSGIVSPGDSQGTLTVNHNYTQNAGGTLRIEVAGLAPSQHDLLAVNGHASLAGTLQLVRLGGFNLHVGDQVTFLTANGGVSGTFGTVQNPFLSDTIVKAQLIYLPNAVVFEGTQGSFVEAACTPNTVAVAQALDSAVGDPRASGLIGFLNNEPLSRLCSDFALIAPEGVASIFNIGVSLANVQTANLNRRMDDIRAGSTGFSAAGFTLNGNAPSVSGGLAGESGPEGKSGPSVTTPENRWGVWVTGIGEFTNVDSTDNAAGYYLQTGGLTLGVDYRVCSNFAIGLTAGYAHTSADLANGGSLAVNGGTLGLYATVFDGGFYLDAAVTGGPSGYDSHRTALLGSANGSTDGGDLNVLVAAGYEWKKGGLTIGPTANFQFTYVGFSSFTESGSLAPLKFPNQNTESERTAFGMKASYDWKVGHVLIKPEISVAWQHEYGDQSYSIVSSFASGAGNNFTVTSPKVGRDSLLIGAGAAVLLSERISIYAYYDGELGRTNYQSNNVSAGVRMTF